MVAPVKGNAHCRQICGHRDYQRELEDRKQNGKTSVGQVPAKQSVGLLSNEPKAASKQGKWHL
jgi:hypothetical protein